MVVCIFKILGRLYTNTRENWTAKQLIVIYESFLSQIGKNAPNINNNITI